MCSVHLSKLYVKYRLNQSLRASIGKGCIWLVESACKLIATLYIKNPKNFMREKSGRKSTSEFRAVL